MWMSSGPFTSSQTPSTHYYFFLEGMLVPLSFHLERQYLLSISSSFLVADGKPEANSFPRPLGSYRAFWSPRPPSSTVHSRCLQKSGCVCAFSLPTAGPGSPVCLGRSPPRSCSSGINPFKGHCVLHAWSKRMHAPQCSLQHHLQQPGHGSNLTVHRGMDKEDVVYIYKGILCVWVAQSCLTLCDPTDCSWDSLGKNPRVGFHSLLQVNLPDPGIESALQADSLPSEPPGKPKDVAHIYNGLSLSHRKEQNNAICSNMDRRGDCHAEWSESDREGGILHDIPYMWSVKRNYTNELTKHKQAHRLRDWTYGCLQGRSRGRDS